MATAQQSYRAHLEPTIGEPVVRALTFQSPGARSMGRVLLRLVRRAADAGGMDAQVGVGGNFAVVTETRVILLRGLQEPFTTIGAWPRDEVRGSARRKQLVSTWRSPWTNDVRRTDTWMLRTTLQTPDGAVTLDFDEEHGGRGMLKALGVSLPPLKPARWWRNRPFE